MHYLATLQAGSRRLHLLLAALSCAAVVVACGGGGGSDAAVDQTPPTLTAQGLTRAVVRKGDTAPLPASFAVTVADAGTGAVSWRDEGGANRGSGNTLPLNAVATALAAGEHTLTAIITRPDNGRSAQASFSLLVLAAGVNSDDDEDGLTYDDEKTAGTQPGTVDTDGDGLADGAEAALGTNPALADSDSNGTNDGVQLAVAGGVPQPMPSLSLLAAEAGMSAGIQIAADGVSVTFGSQLNADCVAQVAPFNDPIYSGSSVDAQERCRKRAVRANVGIAPGEFRYFETRRLTTGALPNIGQGIITPGARIDPYCCYIDPNDADYLTYITGAPANPTPTGANPTPSSVTVNSVGGVFVRLVEQGAPFDPSPDMDLGQTEYYGIAVDYRGTDPVVYVVGRDSGGNMVVSQGLNAGPFGGAAAMPMMHGHPTGGTGPHAAINLGLRKFHYAIGDVRAAIDGLGGNGSAMAGGVGIHRW